MLKFWRRIRRGVVLKVIEMWLRSSMRLEGQASLRTLEQYDSNTLLSWAADWSKAGVDSLCTTTPILTPTV